MGEYPASYGKLLQKLLGHNANKGETRTDWRKRPLTTSQLEYAAMDVLHLPALHQVLTAQLAALDRQSWLENEMFQRQADLIEYEQSEGWTRLPGVQTLPGRQLAIVRQVWLWREERARLKNMPARRVLRDDLIIELAKRGSDDPRRIAHIRGLHHSGFQRFLPEIAESIRRGLNADAPSLPWSGQGKRPRPSALLQQFLTAAMSYLCRMNDISPAIVGTSDDVGRLAAYWLTGDELPETDENYPHLLRGWRAERLPTAVRYLRGPPNAVGQEARQRDAAGAMRCAPSVTIFREPLLLPSSGPLPHLNLPSPTGNLILAAGSTSCRTFAGAAIGPRLPWAGRVESAGSHDPVCGGSRPR